MFRLATATTTTYPRPTSTEIRTDANGIRVPRHTSKTVATANAMSETNSQLNNMLSEPSPSRTGSRVAKHDPSADVPHTRGN